MSGEKSGSVRVNYSTLASSEEADALELDRLETRHRQGEELSDSEAKRRKDLRNRVSRRRQRDDERKRRQADRLKKLLESELLRYQLRSSQLQEAVKQAAELNEKWPDFDPPQAPIPTEPDRSSIESVRDAIARLENIARHYQKDLRSAWVRFQQQQAVGNAAAEASAWAMCFRGGAVRTATEVIAGLADLSSLANERRQEVQLNAIACKAREMIETAFPASDDGPTELSNELLGALDGVFEAKNESRGMEALENLKSAIGKEQENRRRTRELELNHERMERAEEQREKTQWVAEQIATVLEDLGYTVSGVDETAFVENGHLYASRSSFPNHVLRFELDFSGNGIKSVPMRVVGEDEEPGAGQDRLRQEDREFDSAWCNANRIGQFRKLAADRGVGLRFKADHPAGVQTLRTVAEAELGKTLQHARKVSRKKRDEEQQLRTRNRP